MKRALLLLAACGSTAAPPPAPRPSPPPPDIPLPVDPEIRAATLPNGVRYAVMRAVRGEHGVKVELGDLELHAEKDGPALVAQLRAETIAAGPIAIRAATSEDPIALEQAIVAAFSDLPTRPPVTTTPLAPIALRPPVVVEPRVPYGIRYAWPVARVALDTEAHLRVELVEELTAAMLHRRLVRRALDGACVHAMGGASAGNGSIALSCFPDKDPAAVVDVLAQEVGRLAQHGFSDSELAAAKRELLRRVLPHDHPPHVDQALNQLLEWFEHGTVPMAQATAYEVRARLLATVARDEVDGFAHALHEGSLRIANDAYQPDSISEARRFAAIVARPIAAFEDDYDHPYVHPAPAGGKVVATAHDARTGATIWTLSNGLVAYYRPLEMVVREVAIHAWLPRGHADVPGARFALASSNHAHAGWLCCSQSLLEAIEQRRFVLDGEISSDRPEMLAQWVHWMLARPAETPSDADLAELRANRAKDPFDTNEDPALELSDRQLGRSGYAAALAQDGKSARTAAALLRSDFTGAGFAILGRISEPDAKRLVEIYFAGLPTGHPVASTPIAGARGPRNLEVARPQGLYQCRQWIASSRPATADDDPLDAAALARVLEGQLDAWKVYAWLDPRTHTRELRFVFSCEHPYGDDPKRLPALVAHLRTLVVDPGRVETARKASLARAKYQPEEELLATFRDGMSSPALVEHMDAKRVAATFARYYDASDIYTGTYK